MWRRKCVLPVIFLLLSALLPADTSATTVEELRSDLTGIPCDNRKRQQAVKVLFQKMGAAEEQIKVARYPKVENVVVEIPGSETGKIIIGAHYDKTDFGCGAIDNWTGIVMMAHLYKTLRENPPDKTFVFVGFGKEEKGLLGSKAMAASLPDDELSSYCAMLNLDSFGRAQPQGFENVSSRKLIDLARELAEQNDIPFSTGIIGANTDSSPFLRLGIPALSLHGLNRPSRALLHTKRDNEQAINLGSVYLGFQLALLLVEHLDACDCAELR
jgi:putative aminopeptidase FrvX